MTDSELARTVWFHRAYRALTGGELKHAHYFAHTRAMPGFAARISFTGGPLDAAREAERRRLWPVGSLTLAEQWAPADDDVLFVAGTDWRYVGERGLLRADHPTINFVQHVRHADPETELYRYLPHRAVRICVSAEVADAVASTERACGPIVAIPNGTDVVAARDGPTPAAAPWDTRARAVTIVGYKRRDLASALSERLHERELPHELVSGFVPRAAFLELLADSQVVVCLPDPTEGFYLPALEAMASGCLVVTLDAVGNRGFCRHEDNCFISSADAGGAALAASLAEVVERAVRLPAETRNVLLAGAAATVATHALHVERSRFHAVLADIDRLWAEARTSSGPSASARKEGSEAPPSTLHRPRLACMIAGAQKCGTTALAQFLDRHPEIGMSSLKEVHLFDAPEYSPDWTPTQIDERYRPHFAHCRFHGRTGETVLGEATPVYLFFPDVAAELKRYNPELKLIVLLRDPVARAISHYYMERGRGSERRGLWLALLLEPLRLRRCRDPRHPESAHRVHSYRARGLYSRQLQNLYRSFDRERVLVLRGEDLLQNHDAVMGRVFVFLGVSRKVRVPPDIVFEGERGERKHRFVSLLLRISYLAERGRMRGVLRRAARACGDESPLDRGLDRSIAASRPRR